MAALYLIPVTLGATAIDKVIPAYNIEVIHRCRHFIVEKSARHAGSLKPLTVTSISMP